VLTSITMPPSPATPGPADGADLAAPLLVMQETAVDFSTALLRWLEQSPLHALLMLGIIASCGVLLALLRYSLLRLLGGKSSEPPRRGWAAVTYRLIRASSVLFLLVLGAWVTAQYIRLPKGMVSGLNLALQIAGFFQMGLLAREIILLIIERRLGRSATDSDQPVSHALGVISWLVGLCVWSLTLLLLLDNLGVNVTALVAGLGIGGLALGLAAQGIISDLFSALSIILDRPFVRGDFITFADKQGTVERIGLKTSRLRALSGETIVVANNKLLGETIHNHQQMRERRMLFRIGLTYDSPPDTLAQVPGVIERLIRAQPECRFDRAHLVQLGASSIDFEAVYFFGRRDYAPCMSAHQAILLGLMKELAALGLTFAYPTQTVYLARAAQPKG